MKRQHRARRGIAVLGAGLLAAGTLVGPAEARQDAGPPVGDGGGCLLERVGDQFVRCDLLTGNGVPAPAFIPERG
ncbi:hypothetical protein [Phycicoccus sp.]|uniref:hypothetical protein n=1 Tax=Phycicoccus sp. TaxID=1902410 RepID=UPI002C54CEB1|nr:hypothetical protein [Phycicoccus sp.]HMM95429.1 hypothetical protein [Phycicoccus sp.]